jgi:hypothetical protein
MKRDYQPWTSTDIRHAAAIWQRDFADLYDDGKGANKPPHGHITIVKQKIADALQRSISAVQARFHDYGPSFDLKGHDVTAKAPPPANSEEIERRKRLAALDRRDLTASVFGDPPPGYSALDQRRQGVRA